LNGIISSSLLNYNNDSQIKDAISCHRCPHWTSGKDTIWKYIENNHHTNWGNILDAGTGEHSLDWLLTLQSNSITAITASTYESDQLKEKFKSSLRESDQIIVGDWTKAEFETMMNGSRFDVIIADYLLGAMEGFSPYMEDTLFTTLHKYVSPNGHLFLVGQEPYPLHQISPSYPETHLVGTIMKIRDICLMLVGEHFYREYPVHRVLRSLSESGWIIEDVALFPINWGKNALQKQTELCLTKMKYKTVSTGLKSMDTSIKDDLKFYSNELIQELNDNPLITEVGICFGFDYVLKVKLP